jgi:nicotinate-nucleotide--dimethylbenzimidazole phosphoribosyltransferase
MHLGTVNDPGPLPGVVRNIIASETANFSKQIAMDDAQLSLALDAGRAAVEGAKRAGKNIFIGGDMGIANTTSAAALVCAYLNLPAEQIAGPGTGLDQKGVNHKVDVINAALTLHQDHLVDPIKILRCMGGFEIVALSGAFIRAAQVGLPVVVDGFIASAAALAALKINPSSASWMLLSHVSAEPGYLPLQRVLESSTGCTPLFDLGLRLGEGSGAAVALPLIQNACALHCGMATFEQAGVSEG